MAEDWVRLARAYGPDLVPGADGVIWSRNRTLHQLLSELAQHEPLLVCAPGSVTVPSVRGHRMFRLRSVQPKAVADAVQRAQEALGSWLTVVVVGPQTPRSVEALRATIAEDVCVVVQPQG